MTYYRELKCDKCNTLVGIKEVDVCMPYKTMEMAECPICGETIFQHNSRGDFESEVISTEETIDPYKSKIIMQTAIAIIKERISACKEAGDSFIMPPLDGATIEERELPTSGSILLHTEYEIHLANGGYIHIDYQSKDKCRTFQINPDRSYIDVTCSDPEFDFSDAWDENN